MESSCHVPSLSSSTCSLTSSAFFGVPSPGAPVSLTLSTHHCLTSVSSQLYALAMSGVSEPCLRQEKHCILYVCCYSKRETESVKEKLLQVNSRHLLLSMAHVGVQSKEIKAIIQKGAVPEIQSLAPVSCLLPVWCKPWVSLSRQGTKFCQKTDFIALSSSSVEIGQEVGRPLKKTRLYLWSPASPQMLPATELTDLVLIAFFSLLMPFAKHVPRMLPAKQKHGYSAYLRKANRDPLQLTTHVNILPAGLWVQLETDQVTLYLLSAVCRRGSCWPGCSALYVGRGPGS